MRLIWWVVIGVVLAAGGGAGLWLVVSQTMPTHGLLAGVLLLLAVTAVGITLPIAGYLNQRFGRCDWRRLDAWRVPRQAAWAGLFVALCAWLQSMDLLTWTMIAILVLMFILVETYFLSREK